VVLPPSGTPNEAPDAIVVFVEKLTTRDGHYFCGKCSKAGLNSAGNFLIEKLAILEQ
jgi:hypothetical protein